MLASIFGLILILFPFILIYCFADRRLGFLYIITFIFSFHLTLAILTQSLHYFNYPTIITINILSDFLISLYFFKQKKYRFKININWLVIISFLIILFELWSVHFNYSGLVNSINGENFVHNQTLEYPYYSDEWIGVSLTKYSISTNSLPTINPLNNHTFINPLVAHFSLLSDLFLILKIDPMTGFPIFSLITGLLICLLIFLLLKANSISNSVSLIITLSVPYIVSGSNLPGLWHLLPFTTSLIALLLSFISIALNKNWPTYIMGLVSFLLYPPMIVFILPVMAIFIIKKNDQAKIKVKHLAIALVSVLIISFVITLLNFGKTDLQNTFVIMKSYIFRTNLDGGIPNLKPWIIIPYYLLPLAVIGIYETLVKKSYIILAPFLIGIIFWTTYAFTEKVFIIDYYRIATITSVLTAIMAGFGLECLRMALSKKEKVLSPPTEKILLVSSLIFFLVLSFSYTERANWLHLSLNIDRGNLNDEIAPTSPATNYLTNEDLQIFKNIYHKQFIAPPWKALTLAVATNNYPLESKSSTISTKIYPYLDFLKLTCDEQKKVLNKYKVNYLYIRKNNCPYLARLETSSEGLILYKYQN